MNSLEEQYAERYRSILEPLAARLEEYVKKLCNDLERIDRITARAKAIDSFLRKAVKKEDGKPKYSDPLNQIQDQVGVRITVLYLSDVEAISRTIERYFRQIERQNVVPDSEAEFGYFGRHYVLLVPTDLQGADRETASAVRFFELQIKTVFQHAWSEAEHDLGYKPHGQLSADQKRRMAFTAAQAWGADRIFEELQRELT